MTSAERAGTSWPSAKIDEGEGKDEDRDIVEVERFGVLVEGWWDSEAADLGGNIEWKRKKRWEWVSGRGSGARKRGTCFVLHENNNIVGIIGLRAVVRAMVLEWFNDSEIRRARFLALSMKIGSWRDDPVICPMCLQEVVKIGN